MLMTIHFVKTAHIAALIIIITIIITIHNLTCNKF